MTTTDPDDDVLRALAENVRSAREEDAAWEAYAKGGPAPELPADASPSARTEHAAKLDVYRPFDLATLDRMASRVVAERADGAPAREVPKTTNVVRGRFSHRLALGGGVLALAACLAFVVSSRSTRLDLPSYTVEATGGGAATMRGDGPKRATTKLEVSRRASADADIEIVLRPEAKGERLSASAFAETGSSAAPLEGQVDVSAEGAVRIRTTVAKVRDAGAVLVVIGDRAKMARAAAVAGGDRRSAAEDGLLLVRVDVVTVD